MGETSAASGAGRMGLGDHVLGFHVNPTSMTLLRITQPPNCTGGKIGPEDCASAGSYHIHRMVNITDEPQESSFMGKRSVNLGSYLTCDFQSHSPWCGSGLWLRDPPHARSTTSSDRPERERHWRSRGRRGDARLPIRRGVEGFTT